MDSTKLEAIQLKKKQQKLFININILLQMFDEVGGYVDGEMNIPQGPNTAQIGQPDFNTLDEPIKVTVVRICGI